MKKRIVKHPDIRRMEIMSAAEKLFQKNGYEKTPVEAIIQKADIAKGTFYHYFKTKQDILQALVEQLGEAMKRHFIAIVELPKLNAIEKLQLMIRGREKQGIISSSVMKIIHKPENRELQERLNIYAVLHVYPILAKVFQQGFKEKIFKNQLSLEAVQMIFAGSQFILDSGLFTWSATQQANFLKSGQAVLETLVGVKPGVFDVVFKEK